MTTPAMPVLDTSAVRRPSLAAACVGFVGSTLGLIAMMILLVSL